MPRLVAELERQFAEADALQMTIRKQLRSLGDGS
jgi:hypothetical protein